MQLQESDIAKLAKLARLELPEHVAETFREQLTDILGYVDQVAEVEGSAKNSEPEVGRLAEDVPGEVMAQPSELLKAAPCVEEGHIRVLRVK